MKFNKWTLGLAALGVVSLASVAKADEKSNPLMTALSSTTISGYVDTTAIWKFGRGNANMPGRVYDGAAQQDQFNLNVVSLTLDKPVDENQWAAGYHVQLLMGPGATQRGSGILQPAGANNSLAFNEAYIALRVPVGNGLDLKVGQYGTYNGYEAYDTYKNPNWSRSYGFFIESSAHTGISASYKVNDIISLQAGVANAAGYNNGVNATVPGVLTHEGRKAYLAMLTLTAPDSAGFLKGSSLSLGYTDGPSGPNGGAGTVAQQNFYAGASLPSPIEGLSWGVAFDYTTGSVFKHDYAEAIAGYFSYKATDKLTLNERIDYAKGSSGTFGYTPVASATSHDELIGETFTLDYSLWANVVSRLEFRWDHCMSGDKPFGGTVAGAPSSKNAVSLAANIIYKF